MSTHVQQKYDNFKHHIKTICDEINNKFDSLRSQLDKSEEEILSSVRTVESDALSKYDIFAPELRSICTISDAINATSDTSESQNEFIDTKLKEFTLKIDEILLNTGIEDTIKVNWKIIPLNTENICELITQNHKPLVIESITRDKGPRRKRREHNSTRDGSVRSFQNRQIPEDNLFGVTKPFSCLSMSPKTPTPAPNPSEVGPFQGEGAGETLHDYS